MTKPLSLALRIRIIRTIEVEGMSWGAAGRFGVRHRARRSLRFGHASKDRWRNVR